MKAMRKVMELLGAAAICLATSVSVSQASEVASLQRSSGDHFVNLGQTTLAPFAFIRFCLENPADCEAAPPARVAWSSEARKAVSDINRRVNRQIVPVADIGDKWEADVAEGDCDDYALTKRRALLAMGIPSSALRMATAITPNGVGHAVLVVATTEGDFVLDNRVNEMRLWNQTDLNFLKIASASRPDIWQRVEMRGSGMVAMAAN